MTRVNFGGQPDDDFRRVLAALWQSIISPVFQSLCLQVCWLSFQFLPFELTVACRNPIHHPDCGGARPGHVPSFCVCAGRLLGEGKRFAGML